MNEAVREYVAKVDAAIREGIYVRVPGRTKKALQKIAEADGRTLQGLAAKIFNDWLKAQQPLRKL